MTNELATIAAAYFAHNTVAVNQIAQAIQEIKKGLAAEIEEIEEDDTFTNSQKYDKPNPREIKNSIQPDYLICFLDGKKYKTLKRTLTTHGFTPETYRETFGLPQNYPMVAESYSQTRKAFAQKMGLGRKAA